MSLRSRLSSWKKRELPEAQKTYYLTNSQLFKGIPEQQVKEMESKLRMDSCTRGQQLFGEGQPGEVLYILKQGRVRLYRIAPSGRDLTIEIVGPGAVFGEMALLGQAMYNVFAEALEESLICRMSKSDVQQMMTEMPQVALNALDILGRRVHWLEDQLEDIGLRQARARIASHLIRLPAAADREGRKVLSMRYTQEEIAKMAGLARETASLALTELRTEGLIEQTQDRRIRLLDEESLKQLAMEA